MKRFVMRRTEKILPF